ncbi:MAG: DUF4190 domain-containing protein [Actinomycetota bacterium]|nr:DUF4190 domain-containing protein [Actinomycetota bacterium]
MSKPDPTDPGGSRPASQWGQPPPSPPQWAAPPPTQGGQYPPGGYYGQQEARPTNGMAVASMVLGILWIFWIGSVLALVFGYLAKRQIAERGEGGAGLATAGIVLGWIGAATFALFFVLPFILSLFRATAALGS